MTQDEIIRMALEAGIEADDDNGYLEWWNFAKLVAAHERERTKDLTDAEIADALYGKGCWRLGVHPDHLREYRRVIAADRELNK